MKELDDKTKKGETFAWSYYPGRQLGTEKREDVKQVSLFRSFDVTKSAVRTSQVKYALFQSEG